MDQISGLPTIILHDILSRLPQKDTVRTSVLSKAWREIWSTFPVLSICDTQIIGKLRQPDKGLSDEDLEGKRKIFLDYMNKTLARFCDQGLAIKELKLNVDCFDLQYMSKDMDSWMKLVSESGVEVIDLGLPVVYDDDGGGQDQCYALQLCVLEAKTLIKLGLDGGIRVDKAFLNRSIRFFSLRVLSLDGVYLEDEGAIEHLLSHCPLIESITLRHCWAHKPRTQLKSLHMHGLHKLNEVDIVRVDEVSIDAPNLEKLFYRADFEMPGKLNFDSCRNLRWLKLEFLSGVIADQWFLELFSKFPLLESLKLNRCFMSERIKISSTQLKVLNLRDCFDLKEVKIDAPNLLMCRLYMDFDNNANKPDISFLRSSIQLEVNVKISTDYPGGYNVREVIESFKPQMVLTSVHLLIGQLPHADDPNLDVLLVSSPPPSIKHLKLHVFFKNKAFYLPLVNRLLASCCPETISFCLCSKPCSAKAFIEIFYETLICRKQGDCYCRSGHTNCWWHDLKDVKVTSSVKSDVIVDFKTMLDSLPTYVSSDEMKDERICFRLEL